MDSIIRAFKYINAMPFPFSMRHYQVFGDTTSKMKDSELASPESWDSLREDHPFFSIADDREEWLKASELIVKKDGQDDKLLERADDVVQLLKRENIERVFSVGVGGAALEYQIKKRLPALRLACSDYSSVTVERLRRVFHESDAIIEFDLLTGDWNAVRERFLTPHGLCVIYRLDASFSDEQWRQIYEAMARAGIEKILVIPTGALTLLSIYNRKKREVRWHLTQIPVVWSGYLRTKARFREHWQHGYTDEEMRFGGLVGFLLTNRK